MSEKEAQAWVQEQLDKMDLEGRDEFHSYLILQELPFFYRNAIDGEKVEVEWLIKRRGFNKDEAKKMRALADFFNNNGQKIRLIWARLEGENARH
jgi:hypothetical protein